MIIGLVGRKQSGKSTLAKMLVGEIGGDKAYIISMAEPLYDGANHVFIDLDISEGHGELPPKIRKYLQDEGDRLQLVLGKKIFCDIAAAKIVLRDKVMDTVVIPNIRYKHEVSYFYALARKLRTQFVLVRVERLGYYPNADNHSSEAEQEGITAPFICAQDDGDLDGMEKWAKTFVNFIKKEMK